MDLQNLLDVEIIGDPGGRKRKRGRPRFKKTGEPEPAKRRKRRSTPRAHRGRRSGRARAKARTANVMNVIQNGALIAGGIIGAVLIATQIRAAQISAGKTETKASTLLAGIGAASIGVAALVKLRPQLQKFVYPVITGAVGAGVVALIGEQISGQKVQLGGDAYDYWLHRDRTAYEFGTAPRGDITRAIY